MAGSPAVDIPALGGTLGEEGGASAPPGTQWGEPSIDIETTNALSTTGGHVWDAARRLYDFLATQAAPYGLTRKGVRVLELGAGCGWLGLNVAYHLPAAQSVTLTEQVVGGAMEHLEHNLTRARRAHRLPDGLRALGCDWTHYHDHVAQGDADGEAAAASVSPRAAVAVEAAVPEWPGEMLDKDSEWDVLLGSDLVYNAAGVHMLPRVVRRHLAAPGAVMLYAHTRGRFEGFDIELLANLRAQGLAVREVREPWVPSPPPSPPPFTDLFPEMRVVIYEMRVAA